MLPAKIPRKVTCPDSLKSTHTEHYFTSEQDSRSLFVTNSYQKKPLDFLRDASTRKNGFPVSKAYFHIYHDIYIKKTILKKITEMYTKKLKQEFKVQKSIQNKILSIMKSKSKSFFAPNGI